MRPIAVIDAETNPAKFNDTMTPFIWGYYNGEIYKQFYDTEELLIFIYQRSEIVYAHNGGKFDFHFIWQYIEADSEVMVINGRISKFKIGDCEFRDSMNILPTPLRAFQKETIDYGIMAEDKRDIPENKVRIEKYLESDCINLYQYVTAFINRFGLNMTVAGTAFKQWQRIAKRKPPVDDGGVLYHRLSHFYYGGRCQAFEHGVIKGEFKLADINSAYPYAMLHEHPVGTNPLQVSASAWETLPEKARQTSLLTVQCTSSGCLPFRDNKNALHFPNDNVSRTFNVTGWELLAGIKTGHIKSYKIIEVCIFEELIDFKEYMHLFYNERLDAKKVGDKLADTFAKLMMNALYGRFAINPDQFKDYRIIRPQRLSSEGTIEIENSDRDIETWTYAGELGNKFLMSKPIDDEAKKFYNIATAASITGFVRAFMWQALCKCKGLLYCDTDSIAARDIGDLPQGMGKELGQWDIEGEFDSGAIGGKKLYAFAYSKAYLKANPKIKATHKTASKGVNFTAHDIIKVASGHTVEYEPEFPTFSIKKGQYHTVRKIRMTNKPLID